MDGTSTEVHDDVRVRRAAQRAAYDRETIDSIVDTALVAHVGTVRDGHPVVIPMFVVRDGDRLLLHGAPATGAVRRGRGEPVCVTITHVDGIVLARSAFHHSLNYRSVVVVGEATELTDEAEKSAALDLFVDRLAPGRQAMLRPTTEKEARGTSVLVVPLDRASAKVRTGPPIDDDEDYALPIWAGVLPVRTVIDPADPDPRLADGVDRPAHVDALTGDR